jgi:DNA polymerase-3 subunit epsilon
MPTDLTFNSIDIETANADRASICQIGVVQVQDGEMQNQWSTLVDPEDWFDPWNVSIHGIDEHAVEDSPTFPEFSETLFSLLDGSVVITHTSFDRVALERATTKHGVKRIQVAWLDSASIVRRVWPDRYGRSGYGLGNVAKDFGISFQHHDALEDARTAAEIVIRACRSTGTAITSWVSREKHKRAPQSELRIGKYGRALYGETIVFTGALSIPRKEAADLAAQAGSDVTGRVTNDTSILVVGIQDKTRLNGYEKSSKQRKAEELIVNGADIQILSESDFFELVVKE